MGEGKLTQVRFVRTCKSKIAGLITGSDKGSLSVLSYPQCDRILEQQAVHCAEVTRVLRSSGP